MELVNSWVEPGLDLCLMSTITGERDKGLKGVWKRMTNYSVAWPSNSFACILPKKNFEKLCISKAPPSSEFQLMNFKRMKTFSL